MDFISNNRVLKKPKNTTMVIFIVASTINKAHFLLTIIQLKCIIPLIIASKTITNKFNNKITIRTSKLLLKKIQVISHQIPMCTVCSNILTKNLIGTLPDSTIIITFPRIQFLTQC